MAGAAVLSVLGSTLSGKCFDLKNQTHLKPYYSCIGLVIIGVGVGFAALAGGFALTSAWTSGAVVAIATAVVAFVAIRMIARCLC